MKILVVCKANYCRSPVAEKILSEFLGDDFSINSAGIMNFFSSNMHKYSQSFLYENGFEKSLHFPKKINKNIIKESDLILSMDTEVQRYLLKNFPIVEGKIKLFNHETKQDIEDPVKYAKEDYYKCMNKILELCHAWKNLL